MLLFRGIVLKKGLQVLICLAVCAYVVLTAQDAPQTASRVPDIPVVAPASAKPAAQVQSGAKPSGSPVSESVASGTPVAKVEEKHFWPFWSYYKSSSIESYYVPSPLGAIIGSGEAGLARPSPFALYSYAEDEAGNVEQGMLFNLIKAKNLDDEQSVTVGPILKLSNDGGGNAARVEILGGLFALGHTEDGKRAGIVLLGIQLMREVSGHE